VKICVLIKWVGGEEWRRGVVENMNTRPPMVGGGKVGTRGGAPQTNIPVELLVHGSVGLERNRILGKVRLNAIVKEYLGESGGRG